MNNSKPSRHEYYLNSSILFFKSNFKKRINFLKQKNFLFKEISGFINNCIDNTKNIIIFCAGNSILGKNINSNKIFIKEIDEKYEIKYNDKLNYVNDNWKDILPECDTILISDIEHQSNPTSNLLNLSNIIKNDTKIIILSKNMVWMVILKIKLTALLA